MLIIWLQGIWLPLHGYSFEQTPLWAGIYMIPLTIGFLLSAPLSGWLSDRFGARSFTVGGALLTAASFLALMKLPTDFDYWVFALLIVANGLGSGLFASPNRAEIMNAVPAESRGAGAGMTATFQNSSMVLSIGIFFSLMVAGLSHTLPPTMHARSGAARRPGLRGPPDRPDSRRSPCCSRPSSATTRSSSCWAGSCPGCRTADGRITDKQFFPHLISGPFHHGLVIAFWFAVAACVVAAAASLLTDRVGRRVPVPAAESLGSELAAVSGEAGLAPSELVAPDRSAAPAAPRPDGDGPAD